MKVQFLVNIPSPYRVKFFNELSKYVDLTVIYERKSASDRDIKWQSSSNKNYKEIFLNGKIIGEDNSYCPEVVKYIDLKADIIVIGMYSTITAMIAQVYLWINRKEYFLNSDGGFKKKEKFFKRKLKKFFISRATWWLSTGKLTNNYLEYYGAKSRNIFIYPFSSVDEKEIKLKTRESTNIAKRELRLENSKIILSVGQFIPRKGYDILLKASLKMDNKYTWIIIGGQPTDEYLKFIEEHNIKNIIFKSFMKSSELFKYYEAADLFVLPTREDIWGLVINEAMAFGLPIVTTNRCIAGMELIIEDVNGFICEADNCSEFAEKVSLALNKKFDYSKINEMSRKYTIESMALEHYNIFKNILGEKNESYYMWTCN